MPSGTDGSGRVTRVDGLAGSWTLEAVEVVNLRRWFRPCRVTLSPPPRGLRSRELHPGAGAGPGTPLVAPAAPPPSAPVPAGVAIQQLPPAAAVRWRSKPPRAAGGHDHGGRRQWRQCLDHGAGSGERRADPGHGAGRQRGDHQPERPGVPSCRPPAPSSTPAVSRQAARSAPRPGTDLLSSGTLRAVGEGAAAEGGADRGFLTERGSPCWGPAWMPAGEPGEAPFMWGGGFQGAPLEGGGANASAVRVNGYTSLKANARTGGDGGNRGGVVGAGHRFLWLGRSPRGQHRRRWRPDRSLGAGEPGVRRMADASAPAGTAGSLLLDPKNIIIDASGVGASATPSRTSCAPSGDAQVNLIETFLDNRRIWSTISMPPLPGPPVRPISLMAPAMPCWPPCSARKPSSSRTPSRLGTGCQQAVSVHAPGGCGWGERCRRSHLGGSESGGFHRPGCAFSRWNLHGRDRNRSVPCGGQCRRFQQLFPQRRLCGFDADQEIPSTTISSSPPPGTGDPWLMPVL